MGEENERYRDRERLRREIADLNNQTAETNCCQDLQRRLAELEESEKRYRSMVEDISDLIWEVDEENRFTYLSPKSSYILGYEPEELLGRTPFELMSAEESQRVTALLSPFLATHRPFPLFESTMLHKGGAQIVFEVTARPIIDSDGRFHGYRGMDRDVTKRRNAEIALVESQRVLSTLMGNLPGMAYRCLNDDDWTMLFVSDGALDLTGYPPEALVANSVISYAALIHPDDRSMVWDEVQAALAEKKPFRLMYRISSASGEEKWVWEQGRGVFSEDGTLLALEGLMIDDTERKHAEEALALANTILKTQQEASIDGILVVDENGKILSFNQQFVNMWGIPPDVVESRSDERALQAVHNKLVDPEEFLAGVRYLYEHPSEKSYDEIRLIGGITFERYSAPMFGSDGHYLGRVWYFRDITERKIVEQTLEAERRGLQDYIDQLTTLTGKISTDGTVLAANAAAMRLVSRPYEEIIGRKFWDTPWWEHSEAQRKQLKDVVECAASGKSAGFEATHPTPTGEYMEVDFSLTPVFGKENNVLYLVAEGRDVTVRKRVEEALRASERRSADIISFLPDPTFAIDLEGKVIIWNYAMETLTGVKAEDILGKNEFEYAIPFYGKRRPMVCNLVLKPDPEIAKLYTSFVVENHTIIAEQFLPAMKPGVSYLWAKGTPLYDVDGNVAGAIESLRNITDRKLAEEALKASEQRLADIINFLPDPTMVIDTEGRVIAWNHATEELTGVKAEEMLGKGEYSHAVPYYGERRPMLIDVVLQPEKAREIYSILDVKGDTLTAEAYTPAIRAGGVYLWGKASPIRDIWGNVAGAIESVRDITERKKAEAALKESEEKFRALAENAAVAIFVIQDGVYIYTNPFNAALIGYSREELIGIHVSQVIHPDFRESVLENMRKRLRGEPAPSHYEFAILSRDGHEIWVDFSGAAMELGGRPAIVGAAYDITDRKRTAEALQESEEKFRALAENAESIVIIVQESRFVYANPYLSRLTGYSVEELEGMEVSRVIHPEFLEFVLDRLRRRLHGEAVPTHYEFKITGRVAKDIWIDYSAAQFDYRGKPAVVGVGYDITQRKRVDEEKRAFYRETILSATDGILSISDRDGVDAYLAETQVDICLQSASQLVTTRRGIGDFCKESGLVGDSLESFMIGVGEAADNALKHGGEGEVFAGADTDRVWVAVADHGPGIESLIFPRAVLQRGFSTKPSLGLGYSIMLQVADQIVLNTGEDGTTVVLVKNLRQETRSLLDSLPDTWG